MKQPLIADEPKFMVVAPIDWGKKPGCLCVLNYKYGA
jgi:hypothetical protein